MRGAVRWLLRSLALSTLLACHSFEQASGAAVRPPSTEAPSAVDAAVASPPSLAQHDAAEPALPTPPATPTPVVVAGPQDAGVDNPGDVMPVEPPDAELEEPHNDLTFACQSDADCNFGACYVSGRGVDNNPICSKRCDVDTDCPEGARCAAPLDCSDGVGCEGSGYCFRACQTHDECLAFNPSGTLPGDDPDEANPVNCIAWFDIGSEDRTIQFDICIQHSEP